MAESKEYQVKLYVKANAKDGKGLGDCPLCHRIMMILYLKSIKSKYIPIHFTPVPAEFKSFCIDAGVPVKVPVLIHGEYVVHDSNDISYYLHKEWPEPPLETANERAKKVGGNLYSRFCGFLRNQNPAMEEKVQNGLLEELKKINNFLGSPDSPGKFFDGDTLKHPDCDILPKLQHVKVALKKYKKFDIPDYLSDLKQYMEDAKSEFAFTSTCPSDEAIIEGWKRHF